jgi:hypothetical protein
MLKQAKFELLKSHYRLHGLDLSLAEVEMLQVSARRLQHICVYWLNGEIIESEYHARVDLIQRRLLQTLKRFKGVIFEVYGDPRGYCLKIETERTTLTPHYFN